MGLEQRCRDLEPTISKKLGFAGGDLDSVDRSDYSHPAKRFHRFGPSQIDSASLGAEGDGLTDGVAASCFDARDQIQADVPRPRT